MVAPFFILSFLTKHISRHIREKKKLLSQTDTLDKQTASICVQPAFIIYDIVDNIIFFLQNKSIVKLDYCYILQVSDPHTGIIDDAWAAVSCITMK